jgi:GTPase
MAEPFRAGFVAVAGRPNVGKSTLVNLLVGRKVSIVTRKPQTTRHRILGIRTTDSAQIVLVDTPGLHRRGGKAMNRLMNRAAVNAVHDADLVLFLCEANRWTSDDAHALDRIRSARAPVIALLNKIDKVHPRTELLAAIEALAERFDFAQVIPISALRGENIDRLLTAMPAYLPESPPLYPAEMITDRSEAFRVAELLREKLTLCLRQEVPYGLTVQVERLARGEEGIEVDAVVWVEKESQKGIVVGKGGNVLKKAGRAARLELKREFEVPVHVNLWVKVRENWADSESQLRRLGYEPD